MGCVDPSRTTLKLDSSVGGQQDMLWFGLMRFQGISLLELSDTDLVSWMDLLARLITRRRPDSFYLSVDGLNSRG